MSIAYSRPVNQAWQRMRGLLFRPFDLGRWFVLGFTAFLAGLVEGGSGGSSGLQWREHLNLDAPVAEWPHRAYEGLHHTFADVWTAGFLLALLFFGLVFALLLTWLGSRGQFVFLDNLVHRRTEVTAPWSRFGRLGDSLFLWQVVYGLVVLVVMGALGGGFLLVVGALGVAEAPGLATFGAFVFLGIAGFVVVMVLAYIDFFLLHLVVPVMYRRNLTCNAAWSVFLAEFRVRPWPFVLYGLLVLLINLVAATIIIAGGLMTCCVGLVLLAIPYIGTVLILPLPVFVRYLDLEWLGQFGPEFAVLGPADGPAGEPVPEPAGPPPAGPDDAPAAPEASGQLEGDGAVVRPHDPGEDAGGDEPRPEDP